MKISIVALVLGVVFILAGLNHFFNPTFYLQIMPPYLPEPELLILLSGIAEIICGLMLIIPRLRISGAWLSILLLIAVFPANLQMTLNEYARGGYLFYLSLARLPLQFLLIWLLYRLTKPSLRQQ